MWGQLQHFEVVVVGLIGLSRKSRTLAKSRLVLFVLAVPALLLEAVLAC